MSAAWRRSLVSVAGMVPVLREAAIGRTLISAEIAGFASRAQSRISPSRRAIATASARLRAPSFREHRRHVELRGAHRNAEVAGDRLVRRALDHQRQHLALARAEFRRGMLRPTAGAAGSTRRPAARRCAAARISSGVASAGERPLVEPQHPRRRAPRGQRSPRRRRAVAGDGQRRLGGERLGQRVAQVEVGEIEARSGSGRRSPIAATCPSLRRVTGPLRPPLADRHRELDRAAAPGHAEPDAPPDRVGPEPAGELAHRAAAPRPPMW